MDLTKVLAQLRAELANLDAAIISLERLQQEGVRRGRPPKLLAGVKDAVRAKRRLPADQADEEKGNGQA
jgi:hypothetical protein